MTIGADELAELIGHGSQRRSGNSWTVKCPAHDDSTPSLSISDGTTGKVVMNCHAGCSYQDILAAAGIDPKDLRPPREPDKRIDRTYPYEDENGNVLFEVVRFVPKDFRQRRPNGNNTWEWNLRGVRRVPYKLPTVQSAIAAGKTILLVEGEKSVDNLSRLGLCATTTPQGAQNWRDEYGRYFTDARVVVVPDNDEPGHRYAEMSATSCLKHGARSVQILELPGLPAKGDVDDWLVSHDVDELKAVALKAPTFDPNRRQVKTTEPSDEWPEPRPIRSMLPVDEFPVDDLPEAMREMVQAVAASTATPVDFPAVVALGTLAALTARGISVQLHDGAWVAPATLYLAGVMDVGTRKTGVLNDLTAYLHVIENEWRETCAADRTKALAQKRIAERTAAEAERKASVGTMSAGEALDAAMAVEAIKIPPEITLLAEDATPEAVIRLCGANGGALAMVSDEGAAIFQSATRYAATGKANLEWIIKGFEGGTYTNHRIGRESIMIKRLALTMVLCLQPIVLNDLAKDPDNEGRGLLARFLFTMPDSNIGYRVVRTPDVPSQTRNNWCRLLASVASLVEPGAEPIMLTLSEEAEDAYWTWRELTEPRLRPGSDLFPLVAWASKHETHTLRLAAILHTADRCGQGNRGFITEIQADTMFNAIAIWEFFLTHVRRAFAVMDESVSVRLAKVIVEWIKRTKPAVFSEHECHRANSINLISDVTDIRRALLLLCEQDFLRPARFSHSSNIADQNDSNGKRGRGRPPSPRYEPHPSLLTDKSRINP